MFDNMNPMYEDQIKESNRSSTPIASGILYLAVLLLMLLSSVLTTRLNTEGDRYYLYMFLLQLVTIGLPTVLYLIWQKRDIKYTLRLSKISAAEILLSIGLAVFGYGVIGIINLLWIFFLSQFGTPQTATIPPIETGRHYLMAILVIAATPAILEEFMFRGVIQRGYERVGRLASILFTGILFAFLHLSIVSIPAIIVMGILLCYIAYRSNSIWPSIIYHFVNNAIAVTFAYISNLLINLLPSDMVDIEGIEGMSNPLANIPPDQLRMLIIVWSAIGFISLILFGGCFAGFHMVTRGKQEGLPSVANVHKGKMTAVVLPLILAIAIIVFLLVFEVMEMVNPVPVL
ncbi:MAG: CPBP family intramembrane glutamic endopeptidase [Caldicoprobacterales bacterium]|jgi:membrane protease YdiL (CAAX protease family)|nr:CPBP family intramembrane metalloprotease [Clostridiales bacterium]